MRISTLRRSPALPVALFLASLAACGDSNGNGNGSGAPAADPAAQSAPERPTALPPPPPTVAAPSAAPAAALESTAVLPGNAPPALAEARPTSANTATATRVTRDDAGRVSRIEGAGFSLQRVEPATPNPATGGATDRPAAGAPRRQRLETPLVCGAGETRVAENLEIVAAGAGIVAERGCTLSLANVQVRAGGWGLVVNPGAAVRIDASLIEGRTGAVDLYPGGTLSAWASTFRGPLGRPLTPPAFVDRGGNLWD